MTKRRLLLIVTLVSLGALLIFVLIPRQKVEVSFPAQNSPGLQPTIDESKALALRRHINEARKTIPLAQQNNQYANVASPVWEQQLVDSLKLQMGETFGAVKIEKLDSLVYEKDNVALLVESVVIRLTNNLGEESSFSALVDSQSGRILETWNQSISEHPDR
jgi:hypothetical protein